MIDSKLLFKTRFKTHLKEMVRYFQYILNGHIAIAILFLIGAGAVFYQQLLSQLPADFPTDWIVSLLFGLVALYNPIQNLLKKADIVFLLPAEKRLTNYFNYTLIYSFITQIYLVFLVAAALAPLYQASQLTQSYGALFILLIFFKGWNFLSNWWMLRTRDKNGRYFDRLIRFILQLFIFYFFINGHLILASIITVVYFAYVIYIYNYSHRFALAWDQLIEKDQQRMQSFYRLASMFTDVPYFKSTIKKRRLLVNWLTRWIPFEQKRTYQFLYRLTFIRSADYLGVYLRLTVIAGLALFYLDHILMVFTFTLLFLFLTGIQLVPLWYHHRTSIWQDLYPVSHKDKERALINWIEQLLFGQLLIFIVVLFFSADLWQLLSTALVGIVFIIGFSRIYVSGKIKLPDK